MATWTRTATCASSGVEPLPFLQTCVCNNLEYTQIHVRRTCAQHRTAFHKCQLLKPSSVAIMGRSTPCAEQKSVGLVVFVHPARMLLEMVLPLSFESGPNASEGRKAWDKGKRIGRGGDGRGGEGRKGRKGGREEGAKGQKQL